MISEFTRNRHGLELKSHGGTRFNITKLEETFSLSSIGVEELPGLVLVFRELFRAKITRKIFKFVVKNVDGFFVEVFSDFRILVDHISQVGFLEVRVKSLISNSGVSKEQGESCHDFETKSEISKLVEE